MIESNAVVFWRTVGFVIVQLVVISGAILVGISIGISYQRDLYRRLRLSEIDRRRTPRINDSRTIKIDPLRSLRMNVRPSRPSGGGKVQW